MKLHVADNRVEVVLKASYVSFPLLKPEDIGVTQETVDEFMRADDDAVITNSTFGNQYVVVLPRLSKARLISVTKKPQADSKMSEWSGMKRYWKNMYGYRLDTEDGSQPVVYYNVSFYNNNTLTYPEWTVR